MQERIMQIAARIRELREINDCTLESLAREFNIPEKTYRDYESGTADIPVSLLYDLAEKFGVDLSALLTGENPRLRVYSVVREGKGAGVERRKDYRYEHLAHNFASKLAEPFMVTVAPDDRETVSFNSHPGQEFNYLLEGSMKVVIDGHEVFLNEGDSIFFDSSCPHGMKALGDRPARFLAVIVHAQGGGRGETC